MAKPLILVVDDEPDLVELVKYHLVREHYRVETASDGESALIKARQLSPDLIILDLMLPGIDGLEVCRRLRADRQSQSAAIIMLTAKAGESDAVIGLAQGADDYVRKPFGIRELIARVASRLRQAESSNREQSGQLVRAGELVVDSVRHEVILRGESVELTMTEFKLLRQLVTGAGRAYTRSDLLDSAIAPDTVVIDRNVDVHVATLRRKLGDYGRYIETIRGLGYRFKELPVPSS